MEGPLQEDARADGKSRPRDAYLVRTTMLVTNGRVEPSVLPADRFRQPQRELRKGHPTRPCSATKGITPTCVARGDRRWIDAARHDAPVLPLERRNVSGDTRAREIRSPAVRVGDERHVPALPAKSQAICRVRLRGEALSGYEEISAMSRLIEARGVAIQRAQEGGSYGSLPRHNSGGSVRERGFSALEES